MKVLRNLSLLVVAILLLGILAACGGKQPAEQAPAAEPAAAAQPAEATEPAEAAQPTEAAAKTFTVASDASFPPMEFVDENKMLTGFDIDLINAIAADQGFTVEIQNTAWDGIFAGLEAGQYEAIISSVTITEERQAAMDFSDPYFDANQAIIVLADDTAIAGEADLQGKTIGVQIETTGAIAVRELGIDPKQYDSPDLALQDLVNGNIDAVVVDTPVAADYALQSPQFKGKLKIVGELQTNEAYGLVVRKGDPDGLLPLFNAGLAHIKASGKYDAIYEKWIGQKPAGAAEAEGNQAIVTDTSYAAVNCDYGGIIRSIEAVDELTVKFTLCQSDVAFPSKVAFSAFQIHPSEYLQSTGGGMQLVENPIGTGPYKLERWQKGSQIIMTRNDDYWGDKAIAKTLVFQWQTQGAQRLTELQSGTVDGIDNPTPDDFDTIRNDDTLTLYPRQALNVFYLGFNRDKAPFDNEKVRQAIAIGLDRQRIVDNFYPEGSEVASHFTPCTIPGGCEGEAWYDFDLAAAKALLAEAGFADGFTVDLSYRDVVRGYLPEPSIVAQDIQAQLAELGITVNITVMESGAFLDAADRGELSMYLLGWGADYPDQTNFLDYHFGEGASPQFGAGFKDLQAVLKKAASLADQAERNKLYAEANNLIKQHVPMVPVAHGGSATAFKADVSGAHASPLGNEHFASMDPGGRDTLVWMQNGEPAGLYSADETDGEALRVCEQINEALLSYEIGGTAVQPGLAESYQANADLTEWTFKLRPGVKFHDGSALDSQDVLLSYAVQWDAAHPLHVGRDGSFTYFSGLFGQFLNAPPVE
ncbi:MAG: Periplasmic dipeptide transport protein precursor [Chloroflexi bacterium ADurb.Bin325]|nr:MAG: Periplasmic dipeptide transport protein precursor [Chloroflexi bacterium ADurb.Bin325]